MTREKIAILGGGLGSMAAAFDLTSQPGHIDRYDITVYQMGHRLGGKGASGRNAASSQRIEEHGLHIFLGFYFNTFRLLRECYEELGRPAGAPLATLEDAVKPQNQIFLAEQVNGAWDPWEMSFPESAEPLGGPVIEPPEPIEQMGKLLDWAVDWIAQEPELAPISREMEAARGAFDELFAAPERAADELLRLPEHLAQGTLTSAAGLLVARLAHRASEDILDHIRGAVIAGLRDFRALAWRVLGGAAAQSTGARRALWLVDLALTVVVGGLEDRVDQADEGWFSIDAQDLSAWMRAKGANGDVVDGVLLRSLYNLMFTPVGRGAAGTMIHATWQILFHYRGGIFNKMQAGMGDTVFGPLYQVLKARGVKFRFFHRVDELVVAADESAVDAIRVGVQVKPIAAEYDPLVDVLGLPCWPSLPKFELIADGAKLAASGENLESAWNRWTDADSLVLKRGVDFDRVVLGISVGAFPFVAKQLMDASPRFAAMVGAIETVQTQAVQLWFAPDLAGVGWTKPSPVLDGFAEPFDTWADMSHLLPREAWTGGGAPKSIAYLCSSLEDDGPVPPPGAANAAYVTRQLQRVKDNALSWIDANATSLWPGTAAVAGGSFDWNKIVDRGGGAGAARLDSQYWQSAYSPSERYVRAVPGSYQHRLEAGDSGFTNVVLAGDWVKTGVSAGCAEAAVMGGLDAAKAVRTTPMT